MNRRKFGLMLAAVVTIPLLPAQAATPLFLNGELNRQTGTFDWSGGGEDSLRSSWVRNHFHKALASSKLNLDTVTQQGLRSQMKNVAPQQFSLAAVYEGKVAGDVMMSGDGWIALRPRVLTRRWKQGRSVQASFWAWTNQATGERWQIVIPDVCNNLILTRLGQAVPCRCVPTEDACV